jgi:hypothetical protein
MYKIERCPLDQLQSIPSRRSRAETGVLRVGKNPASLGEVCIVPKYYIPYPTEMPRYAKYFKIAALVQRVFCAYYEL